MLFWEWADVDWGEGSPNSFSFKRVHLNIVQNILYLVLPVVVRAGKLGETGTEVFTSSNSAFERRILTFTAQGTHVYTFIVSIRPGDSHNGLLGKENGSSLASIAHNPTCRNLQKLKDFAP